jgi:NAD(P)H dehydrogenase (quinone)
MILVTGAAGKTGRAVIRALSAGGETIRALVHRPEQEHVVKQLGAQDVVAGDMRSPAAMERAVRGVGAIYHICPNVHPDEVGIGQAVITAGRRAGVQHLVYHSVLHPQTEAMSHHWQKLRVEEKLIESGLSYTILQPAAYMQNVLAHWDRIVAEGIYPVPYPAETRLSMVDLEDVAEVAALILARPDHLGATYELVGTEALSQIEVADGLSQQLGRPVCARIVPIHVWEREARDAGMGDYQVETLAQMFDYYARYGFWGHPRVLSWLLGRSPTTFAAFVERVATKVSGPSDRRKGEL